MKSFKIGRHELRIHEPSKLFGKKEDYISFVFFHIGYFRKGRLYKVYDTVFFGFNIAFQYNY